MRSSASTAEASAELTHAQLEPGDLPPWVPRSNLAWFALVFAWWILVDISLMRWLSKYAFCVSAPLAMAMLLRPNNVKLFAAMVAASLWAWWLKMPFVVNVIVVGAFFSIVILLSTSLFLLRRRRWPTMVELEERIFPTFRVAVPVVWAFAVLHKTNWDFLNPEISCAVLHYQTLRSYLPFLPSAADHPAIGHGAVWTAWVFEFTVPLLLFLALLPLRTARWFALAGIVLAYGFHYVMSLNGYQNFSTLGLAFYIPFMPKDIWQDAVDGIGRARRRWGRKFRILVKCAILASLGFGLLMWLYSLGQVYHAPTRWPGEGRLARAIGWAMATFYYCPLFIAAWAWFQWKRRHRHYDVTPGRVPVWAYGLFAVICLNGMSPYLGLKTENSFAMFSNILTEGHHWNHVFLPESMQVFGYQDRMVTIHDVAVPGQKLENMRQRTDALGKLAELSNEKFRVVEFEFNRLTAQTCHNIKQPIAIRYEINGEQFFTPNAHQEPQLTSGNWYWAKKLMMFRWVPNNPRGICLH